MKAINKYKNKKILVVGLAKSGLSTAKLLHRLGAIVTVNDSKSFENNSETQDLLSLGIRVITGGHPLELLDEPFEVIMKNPGIPYSNPLLQKAFLLNIPILTEVELAYQIAECPIIGITGTNGKTTLTTMLGLLLNTNRELGEARLAGNIGFPASEVAQNARREDDIIMELSSFQLMGIDTFRPTIAVITNIYEAHIDYHGSREAYVEAKWRIQKNMTVKDYLIINWNQLELQALSQTTQATIIPFSTTEKVAGAYVIEQFIHYQEEWIMPISELGLPGSHNIENALAAVAVAKLKGISNETIRQVLTNFTGVPHRMQYVDTINQRKFYNDSKATNSLATKMAIASFEKSKLILLAGGLDRKDTFVDLQESFRGLKAVVLFGESKKQLYAIAKKAGIQQVKYSENAETAVKDGYDFSEKNDTILLSPACASWDQYPNFEIRGEKFMDAVQKLKEKREE